MGSGTKYLALENFLMDKTENITLTFIEINENYKRNNADGATPFLFNFLLLKKSIKIMSEIIAYKIQQIVDNGTAIQISLVEDVQTEPVSQKQLIIENVSKKLDSETKEQVMPLLEAILHSQPTIKVKSYAQTNITITMPKNRYDKMGRPQVGEKLQVDLKKV